ncbi:ATP-binding protein [uncultured Desulfuromonas sp.]|uniref:sensor histidine kinase n=2 Tax=Desulfuromonas TaxID=890 RepID=UPI002617FC07|nr:ATP-binding protein [uncultured Desulfuromonas sp.]
MKQGETLEFVVGAEKRLIDVISEAEVMPLLQSAVNAGIGRATIVDAADVPLWSCGRDQNDVCSPFPATGPDTESCPIFLEGEPVGNISFVGGVSDAAALQVVARVVGGAINSMVSANLKRMLTTEIHTQVVNQSYEELVAINRRLTLSEKKYRDLAATLEGRVQERTEELKQAYTRMIQQEKMASIGQLAAGVAHEINNPLGFVLSNLHTLNKYVGRFLEMLEFYAGANSKAPGGLQQTARQKWRELKLDFITGDVVELFQQSIGGAERVKKIVSDLRGFSHVDDLGEGLVDVNCEIERTLSVLSSETPEGTRIGKSFCELPEVPGDAALLCQAFMNIIRNAFQARPDGLKLTIRTERQGDWVRVEFADNGPGIEDGIKHRIFEPFFTTREVGRGMGLGLSVAYDIIASCDGTIEAESPSEGGATFVIQLRTKGREDE